MSAPTTNLPLLGTMAGFRRFTVAEYHRLTELGILTEDDNLELLNGYLVLKMARNPPHDGTVQRARKRLERVLPAGWEIRVQSAVTLSESEPEPDLAVVRTDVDDYMKRHPNRADIGLIVEVSDSTLAGDRVDKGPIYARDNIACYWIVNLVNYHIEVYTTPSGPATAPSYAQQRDYLPGDTVPLILDGILVASIPVQELLP
jgi:Uma2 family endonuclease